MPTFKMINRGDIQTSESVLTQLVDIIESDMSGSSTRKTYSHFVTGNLGPGVTSSLYQTVYDQDYSFESANPIADITFGVASGSLTIANASSGLDSSGKLIFPENILMGREKVNVYNQMAKTLLGSKDYVFEAPFNGLNTYTDASTGKIDHALFFCMKRLFTRDGIKRQSFAMRMHTSSSHTEATDLENISLTSENGSLIFTDIGVSTTLNSSPSGRVGTIAASTDSNNVVGNVFYDMGIVVLDMDKVMSGSEHVSGSIGSVLNATGTSYVGVGTGDPSYVAAYTNPDAAFIPDLLMSASIDDVLNHISSCRISSGSLSTMSFQNQTMISSTLVFCKIGSGEFNYSSNPSYVNSSGDLVVLSDIETDKPFSYITTIGLYDSKDNLLAIAKTSRPIENNFESDLSFRIRLDF